MRAKDRRLRGQPCAAGQAKVVRMLEVIISQARRLLPPGNSTEWCRAASTFGRYKSVAYKYSRPRQCLAIRTVSRGVEIEIGNPTKAPRVQGQLAVGSGQWTGQGRAGADREQGSVVILAGSRGARDIPVSLPFSTFRSPVESRLQISDSKLVLIITKYAYVQRNPANGLGPGRSGYWAAKAPHYIIASASVSARSGAVQIDGLRARSLDSLAGAPAHTLQVVGPVS